MIEKQIFRYIDSIREIRIYHICIILKLSQVQSFKNRANWTNRPICIESRTARFRPAWFRGNSSWTTANLVNTSKTAQFTPYHAWAEVKTLGLLGIVKTFASISSLVPPLLHLSWSRLVFSSSIVEPHQGLAFLTFSIANPYPASIDSSQQPPWLPGSHCRWWSWIVFWIQQAQGAWQHPMVNLILSLSLCVPFFLLCLKAW